MGLADAEEVVHFCMMVVVQAFYVLFCLEEQISNRIAAAAVNAH